MAGPAEQFHYPCDSCGADLRYAPGQTALVCNHCGHTQTIPAASAPSRIKSLGELDLNRALRDDLAPDDMTTDRATQCPSCGARVEIHGATQATQCPFCASPVVVDTGTTRHIKPQALVPFVLTETAARKSLTAWMGSLWFAPNGLLEYARKGRSMDGVYVPFWTFDAETASRYSGQRGDYYYETRSVTVNVNGKSEQRTEQVRHTRWSNASGHVSRDFDDVLVMASTSVPRRYGDALSPWDLTALVPYTPDYLSGFQAEGYTVTLTEGRDIARTEMAQVIHQDVCRDIGGDEQRVSDIATQYSAETFKHILLPIWIAAYKYNGKSYRFMVNGQTGEVQGERPYSAWKIAFAVVLGAIAAAAIAYLYLQSQQ